LIYQIKHYKSVKGAKLNITYAKYNVLVADEVEDNAENILIVPEAFLRFIPEFKNIQICIWWMSVDNAFKTNATFTEAFNFNKGLKNKLRVLRNIRHYSHDFSYNDLLRDKDRYIHFYQCKYIEHFLYSSGFATVLPLTDYINPQIISSVDTSVKKENVVLYNPKKGIEYTKRIIDSCPNVKFIPLTGFTREQLNHLFDTAKLYIDFGLFPGKDRLPREAAIHNCCLITGKFGASSFFEDLPIPSSYKFDINNVRYEAIKAKIMSIFATYEKSIDDFCYLRSKILTEKETFFNEIENIFL
jgi:hypothetical protein